MKPETIKALLKKVPLILLMYLCAGCFCRWYQLHNELMYDGSLVDGAFMHRVLFLLTLTFVVGFAGLVYGLKNISSHKDGFPKNTLFVLIQICAGTLLTVGSAVQLNTEPEIPIFYTPTVIAITRFLPYAGILAGVLVIAFALCAYLNKTPSPLLYMLLCLYMAVRLIVLIQSWNVDPSVHDYVYKLLAAIAGMLAYFQIAGFGLGKGKRRITVFWCLCSVFFCAVSIPDYFENNADLLINVSLLLLSLTHGLQLLYAPDPKEEAPMEETSEEVPSVEEA